MQHPLIKKPFLLCWISGIHIQYISTEYPLKSAKQKGFERDIEDEEADSQRVEQ